MEIETIFEKANQNYYLKNIGEIVDGGIRSGYI
jgi:hypothetical protein